MLRKHLRGAGATGHRRRHGGRTLTEGSAGRHTFGHGRLRFVLLRLIGEQPTHGYELIKAIEEKTGGAYVPSPGVIYPTLTLLEEMGYVSATEDGTSRKLYTITASGKKFLEANKQVIEEMDARTGRQFRGGRGNRPLPLMRAMENLKTAMRLRVSQGELTAKQLEAIAEILDAAARKIETA